jgi:phosphoribosylaminoimidazole-succinocarboxamide synthase
MPNSQTAEAVRPDLDSLFRSAKPVFQTNLPGCKLLARGKVRDIYDLDDQILIVATDRISAFDSVLGTPIPLKGRILTQMAAFWFGFLKDVVTTHFITADFDEICRMRPDLEDFREQLDGRCMLVNKARVMMVECVVRGYLIGSGWNDYQNTGGVCGIELRKGLLKGARLDPPLFTPASKNTQGHDQNISFAETAEALAREAAKEDGLDPAAAASAGAAGAAKLRDLSLAVYNKARDFALERGIIIADTKLEFGVRNGEIILVDEVLTPDSSRFWPADSYAPGKNPLSYDKQFVRDYLEACGWDKQPPGPSLPDKVVRKTFDKYFDAYFLLTGKTGL